MKRIVVTGLGVISPIGVGQAAFVAALKQGTCGARPLASFDTTGYRTSHGCEAVDFPATTCKLSSGETEVDRATVLALSAAAEAVRDAGIDFAEWDPRSVGVSMATSLGGILCIDQSLVQQHEHGYAGTDPTLFLHSCPSVAGVVAKEFGLRGPIITISTACAAGTNSIGYAFDLIREGRCLAMICGGTDPYTRLSFSGFNALKSLSKGNIQPFTRDRDGLLIGEAAAMLVLEELEHAQRRGAQIYAEVLGYGISNDAYHATSPDPKAGGAIRAMLACREQGNFPLERVNYINAHGTATKYNDQMELLSLKSVFGDRASRIPISSTKSMIGHTLGCAGSIEALTCALAIKHKFLPPTANFTEPMEGAEMFDFVPVARDYEIDIAISNSFAFAGNTASIAMARLEEQPA